MRSILPAAAALALALLPTAATAMEDDTLLWVEMRGGMGFFNDIDPDPVERLATQLSADRQTAGGFFRKVEFVDKNWEIPFDVRVGMKLSDTLNAWVFYERLPYLLESQALDGDTSELVGRIDTVTLNIPGNVFGAGFDFRLGSEGYGNSILVGFGAGQISVRGDDEDFLGFNNYEISGSSVFWEVQAMAEFEFTTEMSFLPFVSFRSATVTNPDVAITPRGIAGVDNDPDYDDFEIDYTGVTVGLAVRFRIYPFDIVGDPDRADDD